MKGRLFLIFSLSVIVACGHDHNTEKNKRTTALSRVNFICRAIMDLGENNQLDAEIVFDQLIVRELIRSDDFFNDPWGSRYRMLSTTIASVYSIGANRIDERGNGDDIVCQGDQ